MPDGFDIAQRPGVGPPGGGPPGGGPPMGRPPAVRPPMGRPPMGRPPMGRPPMGRPPMGRPPFRRPRRRPIFPVFPFFPPGRCFFIDRFGRCCDRFGRCCDRFGRCSFGGFYGGLSDDADTMQAWYDGGWDMMDEDWDTTVFNEMDSDWYDQY